MSTDRIAESPAPAGTIRKSSYDDWRNRLILVALTVAAGAVMASYVMWVKHMTVHQKFSDAVEQAALTVAQRLSAVSVQDSTFGRVGLCDLPAEEAPGTKHPRARILGLNSLYATLRFDKMIAHKLNNQLMAKLCEADLVQARNVETELCRRLYQSIEPNPYRPYPGDEAGSIYQQVLQELSVEGNRGKRRLVDLKLGLGSLDGNDLPCSTRAPRMVAGQQGQDAFIKGGFYRPFVAAPVPGSRPVRFYPLSDRAMLVDAGGFRQDRTAVAPSVVIVYATYRFIPEGDRDGRERNQVRVACALIGAPAVHRDTSAFMLNFPHGVPPQFSSVVSLMNGGNWVKPGQWQQAITANVPGDGSLGPPADDSQSEMLPSDALVMALYHWLRYVGTDIDMDNLTNLLQARWPGNAGAAGAAGDLIQYRQSDEPAATINSCLVRETGARQYAILNQTGPGGAGQSAISDAFSAAPFAERTRLPSALPLTVDATGNVNLPGHRGFDKELVSGFFQALHNTNLAGIESQSTTRSLIARAESSVLQIDRTATLAQEELSSLNQRGEAMTKIGAQPQAVPMLQLKERLAALQESIDDAEMEKKKFQKVIQLAKIAAANGEKAALKSYEICTRMSRLAAGGVELVSSSGNSYLLSKKWLFVPHTTPVSEEEIIAISDGKLPERSCPWLFPEFAVFEDLHDLTVSAKRAVRGNEPGHVAVPAAAPAAIILDSEALKPGRTPRLKYIRRSPFGGVGIPLGQMFYYAENALSSGDAIKVSWSVVLRDLVAYRGERNRGEAQPSSEIGWCRQSDVPETSCPGLACEFQVSYPLPVVPGFQTDIYLTNSSNQERASLIPPVPSGMI